jgi:hypothetical protein
MSKHLGGLIIVDQFLAASVVGAAFFVLRFYFMAQVTIRPVFETVVRFCGCRPIPNAVDDARLQYLFASAASMGSDPVSVDRVASAIADFGPNFAPIRMKLSPADYSNLSEGRDYVVLLSVDSWALSSSSSGIWFAPLSPFRPVKAKVQAQSQA